MGAIRTYSEVERRARQVQANARFRARKRGEDVPRLTPGAKRLLSDDERAIRRRESMRRSREKLHPKRPKPTAEQLAVRAELKAARLRAFRAEWSLRHAEMGLCRSCNNDRTHGLFCEHHWFWNIAMSHKMTPRAACTEMLKDLWREQAGRCALTGADLVPGKTASIDHKIARAKGGGHNKENLQWVLKDVNGFKASASVDEFIAMCRAVVAHADKRVVHLRKVEV